MRPDLDAYYGDAPPFDPDEVDHAEPLATEAANEARADEWPELIRLDARPTPPRFPVDALPVALREYVEAVTAATETPLCWGGALALAAVASVAQEHYAVQIPGKLHPDQLAIGVGIVSPPATRKSELFRAYSQPIADVERARQAAWEIERTAAGDAPFTKPRPRILFDDAGPEYLTEALAQQGGQIAVWSSEGAALANACGRYSKGKGAAAIEVFLQGMAGDRITSDRCGKDGRHVNVQDPALTFAATMQPSVLEGVVGDEQLRGRGLVARILWVLAPHGLGHRKHRGRPPVPQRLQLEYAAVIERLSDMPTGRGDKRIVVQLDDDAHEVFVSMLEEREPKIADGGELESVRDWAGKIESLFCRVATLLALVEGKREIDKLNARRALRVVTWALAHARVALDHHEDPAVERARTVWRWAEQRRAFTKRDAHNGLRGSVAFRQADSLDAPLRMLVELGYLRPGATPDEPRVGRPASPTFEVRPPEKHPHNPHNRSSADSADVFPTHD